MDKTKAVLVSGALASVAGALVFFPQLRRIWNNFNMVSEEEKEIKLEDESYRDESDIYESDRDESGTNNN